MTFTTLLRRAACALTLAASGAAIAGTAAPRLWEAVKPSDPNVRIYILAAGADDDDGYFDRIVMPAFALSHVLHHEVPVASAAHGGLCGVAQIHAVDVDPASGTPFPSCLATDRAALLRAASAPAAADPQCARSAAWLGEFARMDDGLTHFVIADVDTRERGCKGLLGELAEAGYVLWPVAEFGTERADAG
ncbi:hypothetical protein IP92_03105 [Pseudoduganella flava]|uniref:Uncharacterized protein n=1 Tax=Pseudoduganella flava TaxID=871742 RepID=A0A562PQM4_9BURK|nr:hypothetical protein [Pseudoduganella flava]QGZ37906.1 hypothetical protein GO485_01805 [Pseudoduganella flava]TWI46742.1 hypothetical protein IP92_03105 [Pseudoduganella flava]